MITLLLLIGVIWACVTDGFMMRTSLMPRVRRKLSMSSDQVPYVPYFPNKSSKDYLWMDVYNALGRDRTLFVNRYLDDEACNQLIASLIWLQSDNDEKPIKLYFNVPGAISKPAWAVFDTMQRMRCPLVTINTGLTVGMGALLCAAGTPGNRSALPNARFLMSRTGMDDGVRGQAVEIHLQVQDVLKDNVKMTQELARLTHNSVAQIEQDLRRDFYLAGVEAVNYGVIDGVLKPHSAIKVMRNRGKDNDLVGFGHFSEAREVKENPDHVVVDRNVKAQQERDARRAAQLAQMQQQLGGRSGFNDRLRPIPITDDDDESGFG